MLAGSLHLGYSMYPNTNKVKFTKADFFNNSKIIINSLTKINYLLPWIIYAPIQKIKEKKVQVHGLWLLAKSNCQARNLVKSSLN